MKFTYENFIKLQNAFEQQKEEINTLKTSYIEVLNLFDFDKGAGLPLEGMKKLYGNIYIVERAKGLNVVRSVN